MPNIFEPGFDEPREHDGFRRIYRLEDGVDYWLGEQPPPRSG